MSTKKIISTLYFTSTAFGVACTLLYFFVSYFYNASYTQHFSADHLYIPLLFKDIFEDGGSFLDWTTPPAPYFFPDMFLFLFAFLFSSEIYIQLFIFQSIQLLTFGFLSWRIFTLLEIKYSNLLSVLCFLVFSLLESTVFHQIGLHFGAFWAATLCVYLTLGLLIGSPKRSCSLNYLMLTTLGTSVFLASVSDKFFLLWFTAPALLILTLLDVSRIIRMDKYLSATVGTIVVASGIGFWTYNTILPNTASFPLRFNQDLVQSADQLLRLMPFLIRSTSGDWYLIILFALGVFLNFYSLGRVVLGSRDRTSYYLSALGVVWTFSLVPLLFNFGQLNTRYFIPTLLIPFISCVILFSWKNSRVLSVIASITILTLSSIVLWNLNIVIVKNASRFEYYPTNVACVDEIVSASGLTKGASTYWNASPIEAFSKRKIEMAHIDVMLNESYWINSKNKFQDSYDFVFVPIQYKETLTKKLTRIDSKIYQCPSGLVIVYDNPKIKLPHFTKVNAYKWLACDLHSETSKVDPLTCARRKRPSSEDGLMTTGPHVVLPPGQYVGSITYTYAMPNDECNATWDVVAHYKKIGTQIVEAGKLCNKSGGISEQPLSFKIQKSAPVEIRTLVGKTDDLTLWSISLTNIHRN